MAKKLPENVERILGETYEQDLKKPIAMIPLPCSKYHKWRDPAVVQITEARDQRITCPKCGKSHYLVWSRIQDNIKWQK